MSVQVKCRQGDHYLCGKVMIGMRERGQSYECQCMCHTPVKDEAARAEAIAGYLDSLAEGVRRLRAVPLPASVELGDVQRLDRIVWELLQLRPPTQPLPRPHRRGK